MLSPTRLPLAGPVLRTLPDPLSPLRASLTSTMQAVFSASRLPGEQYTEPAGDPGLFGPDSVTWRVHADPAMLVGGLTALMLQSLHPLVLAGVLEHSDFRTRPLERLGRTSSFVVATTYGSTPVAERMFHTVRTMHSRVVGTAPDGRPYDATDPDLLTWVHVAEFLAFARSHRRYAWFPVSRSAIDRYYGEVAVIAEGLGASRIPRSRDEMTTYLRDVRPELRHDRQSREAMRFIFTPPDGPPPLQAAYLLVAQAAAGCLPRWAREMLGVRQPLIVDRAVVRPATWTVLHALRILAPPSTVLTQARDRATGSSTAA